MFAGTRTGVFLWRCDSRRDPYHIWLSFFSQEFFRSSIRLQTRLRRPSAFQIRVLQNEVTDKLWSQKVHLYSNARACKTAPPPHFWKQFSPPHLSFAASRFTAFRSASCVHLQGHSLHFELVSDLSIFCCAVRSSFVHLAICVTHAKARCGGQRFVIWRTPNA